MRAKIKGLGEIKGIGSKFILPTEEVEIEADSIEIVEEKATIRDWDFGPTENGTLAIKIPTPAGREWIARHPIIKVLGNLLDLVKEMKKVKDGKREEK